MGTYRTKTILRSNRKNIMNIEIIENLENSGWGKDEIIKEIEIRCGLDNFDASRLYLKLKFP